MSPAQLAQVLKAMHGRYELRSELEMALGTGETQRLLVHQVKDEALLRRVRAVTDTVSGRTAMVGYAAGPARKVAFALIVEEPGADPTTLWARAEEILGRIVEATGPVERKVTQRDEMVEVAGGG